jgi:lipid II:glycine glycyltransferase (peptidoglycan interpeptide bridge formation enzyme)
MSFEQIIETIKVIPADFFIVSNKKQDIASALVFHVSKDIVQVVYWGDLPGFSEFKSINFLSFRIFEHYKKIGKKFIDIGISTEEGIPNYGLCEFKESIGCTIFPKYKFTKTL